MALSGCDDQICNQTLAHGSRVLYISTLLLVALGGSKIPSMSHCVTVRRKGSNERKKTSIRFGVNHPFLCHPLTTSIPFPCPISAINTPSTAQVYAMWPRHLS